MTDNSQTFEAQRPRLFAIAYRMLGSASEAEDIVQDAYLRFQTRRSSEVQSEAAFLRQTVIRLCLDSLKSARARRETYPGTWLPEPISDSLLPADDPAEIAADHESISLAFLLLLEDLTPDERAVFLLREVFDYTYAEIGVILGKAEPACRQLFSRAKKHVVERRPRFRASPEEHRQLVGRFMQAVQQGDLQGLTALLAENVTSYGDGGGKMPTLRHPLTGREAVARLVIGVSHLIRPDQTVEVARINGRETILLREPDGQLSDLVALDVADGLIQGVYFMRNSDKFRHLEAAPRTKPLT